MSRPARSSTAAATTSAGGRATTRFASAERPQEQERGEGTVRLSRPFRERASTSVSRNARMSDRRSVSAQPSSGPEAQRHVRAREGDEEEGHGPFDALLPPRPPEAVGAPARADQSGRGIGQGQGEDGDAEV